MSFLTSKKKNMLIGENWDIYSQKISRWRWASCVSIFTPFLIGILLKVFSSNFSFTEIIMRGDCLLLCFSLTIASLFDTFNVPRKTKKYETRLHNCFCLLLLDIVVQMTLYAACLLEKYTLPLLILFTFIVFIGTYIACENAFFIVFLNQIQIDLEEGETEHATK